MVECPIETDQAQQQRVGRWARMEMATVLLPVVRKRSANAQHHWTQSTTDAF